MEKVQFWIFKLGKGAQYRKVTWNLQWMLRDGSRKFIVLKQNKKESDNKWYKK